MKPIDIVKKEIAKNPKKYGEAIIPVIKIEDLVKNGGEAIIPVIKIEDLVKNGGDAKLY